MKQTTILGSFKTTFGAAAIAAATVLALGTTASNAAADDAATVTASPAGACVHDKECTVIVKVQANAGLHVNTDYNHKVMTEGDLKFLGKSKPNLFSKEDGDFASLGERTATITVRFKAGAKGNATITGKYKFATCKEGVGGGCTPGSSGFSVTVPVT